MAGEWQLQARGEDPDPAGPGDAVLRMYAILLVDVDDSLISRITVFADQRLAPTFGLAGELAG